jgi:hypothetical protein
MTAISKFSLSDLALLSWLLESPEKRFAIVFEISGGIFLWERLERSEDDGLWSTRRISSSKPLYADIETLERFGGKMKFRDYALRDAGLVEMVRANVEKTGEKDRFDKYISDIRVAPRWNGMPPWGANCVLVLPTASAAEWWESIGRARYDKLFAKLQEKKARVASNERVAVFGLRSTYGVAAYDGVHAREMGRASLAAGLVSDIVPKWKGMRPSFSAVVVRETDTRFYIRAAKRLSNANLSPESTRSVPVEHWVSKEYLLLDNASELDIAKLRAFDEEVSGDYVVMRDRAIDAMVPALAAAFDRSDQKAAEIDGTFGDLLAALRRKSEKT